VSSGFCGEAVRSPAPAVYHPALIRIGRLAAKTGVSDATPRFNERDRLLSGVRRSASGQHPYGPEAETRVRLVRATLPLGF